MGRKLLVLSKNRYTIFLIFIIFSLLFFILFGADDEHSVMKKTFLLITKEQAHKVHVDITQQFFVYREEWNTSNLGTWLFKYGELVEPQNKLFSVILWQHWQYLQAWRFDNHDSAEFDPLEGCSVLNCRFTGDEDELATADAILIHISHGVIPKVEQRNPKQRWIFFYDGSPENVFRLASQPTFMQDFVNVFNWSMSYRSDSDIPVPYARLEAFDKPVSEKIDPNFVISMIPNWNKKKSNVLASTFMSNCGDKWKNEFLKQLQAYMAIDVLGKCTNVTTNWCRSRSVCEPLSSYLFYFVIETTNCREYLSEKIWQHAYKQGAIPVIMGPSSSDCKRLLPPYSYIHVSANPDENAIKNLANFIIHLSKDKDSLLSLHQWRNHFRVNYEYEKFGSESYHLCRLCEGLNYNKGGNKIYTEEDLAWFLEPLITCNV